MPIRIERGYGDRLTDKLMLGLLILALVLLFAAMSQPIWRGSEMVKEMKEKCVLAEGKIYERKSWLGGTVYECVGSR